MRAARSIFGDAGKLKDGVFEEAVASMSALNQSASDAMVQIGYDLDELEELEHDAGLGNGGLGRLAACFLDSMATLQLPAQGYGIRYEYGIFEQRFRNGEQLETPDNWLEQGYPWEIPRHELTCPVQFYGTVEPHPESPNGFRKRWIDTEPALAVAYDVPIAGYQNRTVNNLRLWQARASRNFDFHAFNRGGLPCSGRGTTAGGDDLQSPLPQRSGLFRKGTAAQAAVFLCLRVASGFAGVFL